MRIISKFHDYYDIGLGLSHDTNLNFVREPREVELSSVNKLSSKGDQETLRLSKLLPRYYLRDRWRVNIIGFCGKLYPCVTHPTYPDLHLYSLAEVDNFQKGRLDFGKWRKSFYRKDFEKLFKIYEAIEDLEAFIANRSPIVLLTEVSYNKFKASWNVKLQDYGFERIIPPYEAFQAIEMFMSNLALPEKPIPPQSDLQKVESHGFDKKISFRSGKKCP